MAISSSLAATFVCALFTAAACASFSPFFFSFSVATSFLERRTPLASMTTCPGCLFKLLGRVVGRDMRNKENERQRFERNKFNQGHWTLRHHSFRFTSIQSNPNKFRTTRSR